MRVSQVRVAFFLVAMGTSVAFACSSNSDTTAPSGVNREASERVGTLGLQLQPVAGVTVTSLHYTVTNGSPGATPAPITVSEGNLPTPGAGASVSFGIPLPVGTGYYLSLTGVSAELNDDVTCTGSYGPFAVSANQSSALNLQLTCVDNTNGGAVVGVDVQTDACPRLVVDYAVAEPSSTQPGSSLHVSATAHDLDNAAEPITYAWSVVDPARAAAVAFSPANAANTTLVCRGNAYAVTVQVTARNHQCQKSLQTVVSCTDARCGDGFVELELGETCDWGAGPGHPADPTCPADCTKVCGDGNAEGDEQCDPLPLDPARCLPPGSVNECHFRPQVCGDGFVNGTEVCDGNMGLNGQPLPPGLVCPADCRSLETPCGDHVVGAGEECDDGGLSRLCSNTCQVISTPACVACEQAGDCFASSDNCLGPAALPFTLAQQKMCTDVMRCIRDSNCFDGSGTLAQCYCGTLSTSACQAAPFDLTQPGAPNGPCAQVMQQGSPIVTSNSAILGGLTNLSRPGGVAGRRLLCQKEDPACAPVCGLQ